MNLDNDRAKDEFIRVWNFNPDQLLSFKLLSQGRKTKLSLESYDTSCNINESGINCTNARIPQKDRLLVFYSKYG